VISQRILPGDPGVFLAQCETSIVSLAAALQIAHQAGMTTILNVAPIPREPLEDELFSPVDIVIVNETEAAQLTGIAVDSLASAKSAAEQLLALGPAHAIITLGKHGSLWSTRATPSTFAHLEVPSFPVTQVDATAAGDAFCGALAAALAQGIEMMAALKKASAAGSVTVTRMGAYPSLPTAVEVETLI
jgi:ribokinase